MRAVHHAICGVVRCVLALVPGRAWQSLSPAVLAVMEFFEAGPIAEVQRDGMVRCRKAYDVVRLRRHICQIGSGLTYCMRILWSDAF